jgi:hypothetical protein
MLGIYTKITPPSQRDNISKLQSKKKHRRTP